MAGALRVHNLGPKIASQRNFAMRTVTVLWVNGLHLRPAVILINTASRYRARITISTAMGELCLQNRRDIQRIKAGGHQHFDGVLSTVALGAEQNSQVTVKASGQDALEAVKAIVRVFRTEDESIFKQYEALEEKP